MLQETRLHRIRSLISTHHQVSTERIINELGVSRKPHGGILLRWKNKALRGGYMAALSLLMHRQNPRCQYVMLPGKKKNAVSRVVPSVS